MPLKKPCDHLSFDDVVFFLVVEDDVDMGLVPGVWDVGELCLLSRLDY